MGNEEGISITETGLRILTAMKRSALKQDDSRPVTVPPPPAGDYMGRGGLVLSDVMGYNYADQQADAWHKAHPAIPVMGTENVSAVGTRGIYVTDRAKGVVASYDPYTTTGRASAEGWWRFVSERPWVAGGFVWTGFDYRGEPSPYQWPNISSQYGVIDTCGFPKDTFYYYQSWWTSKPVLHILPHWNWPGYEGKDIQVWVHTNMDRVELFHNGQSLGAKDLPRNQHLAWNVAYAPGTLEARGYKDGKHLMTATRETTGPAAKLALRADRQMISADGEDVAVCSVEVQDGQGRVVPITDNLITFRKNGPAEVIGVGNGDPTSHESDIGSVRTAFAGRCMAIVQAARSAGAVTVTATSPGLSNATITITAMTVAAKPRVAPWDRPIPAGAGVTGLWRPVAAVSAGGTGNPMALAGGSVDMVFAFRQDGNVLSGSLEASAGGGFGRGGGTPGGAIEDGVVDGQRISFRVGTTTYAGTIAGDRIELQRSASSGRGGGAATPAPVQAGAQPAVGPPPPGSDPSFGAARGGQAAPAPLVLRRVLR
jgi:beta-galactosidase